MHDANPFNYLIKNLESGDVIRNYRYYDICSLEDRRYERLPFCIRVLLEAAIRTCDNFQVTKKDVEKILSWEKSQDEGTEIPFKPARVILQDFTGVPAVVDFAAMRDAVKDLGGDPAKINPVCPADLVIDHSVQVDFTRTRIREIKEEISKRDSSKFNAKNFSNRQASEDYKLERFRHQRPTTRPYSPQAFGLTCHQNSSRPLSPVLQQVPNVNYNVSAFNPHFQTMNFATCVVPLTCETVPVVSYFPPFYSQNTCVSVPYVLPQIQPNFVSPITLDSNSCSSQNTDIEDLTRNSFKRVEETRKHDTALVSSQRNSFSNLAQKCASSTKNCDTECIFSCKNDGPKVRVPVHTLPSVQDVPGIPIQDSICPFHELSSRWADALKKNEEIEFSRNRERFTFLKWGSQALKNMLIVPPGSGIVHQVNLEYLARVVFEDEQNLLYPDSLVGTDSHTTMINGLGVLGWGVGGIEAEAVMLGQSISMVLPKVIGYKITGKLSPLSTSTDVVLTITKHLRQVGVVGKFVEFFGDGVCELSLADRATISNMCPEYGATTGFFAVDQVTLHYLRQTNRDEEKIEMIANYLKAVKMLRDYADFSQDPVYSEVVELKLGDVVPSVSGPKRPHDRVAVTDMKVDFRTCLINKISFKGFGLKESDIDKSVAFKFDGAEYTLKHGSVVIAAITSCTNTSNPSVMLGAGLLAKRAVEAGLTIAPYVKTSLSPGSGVVTHYLKHSGVKSYLQKLGFDVVGYGCMTCIGNSGPLHDSVVEAIEKNELVCCGILSGNRNFEGRIHPNTRANYLASPLLVVAYAIAGTVNVDFELEPLGKRENGTDVYLRDIWPSRSEIQKVESECVLPSMFEQVYKSITSGNENWNNLESSTGILYPWDSTSTYIKKPPFFQSMKKELEPMSEIKDAFVLLNFGDSVTTDHISPAGSIARNSPAARYLGAAGLTPREFNSYGSRRGNDAVMSRGTFANIRLVNKFLGKAAPRTIHFPSGQEMDIFDAAELYKKEEKSVIILAGKEYGSGSSRDWAAKGPYLLGVRAVIAVSFERIHRSNLVGMGIIPLEYTEEKTPNSLTGREKFSIKLPQNLVPGMILPVEISGNKTFDVKLRFDTEVEVTYFKHGGILNYMIRKMLN